jgi:transposase
MAQPIAPDYGQQFLFPPALEDWINKDHPVRFIREFVDQQNLAALGFAMPISNEGRPAYAPSLLLKIWLYGYYQRLRSTRKLEAACREQLPLLWLTGNIAPDHNSLWRFWRDNQVALRKLFKQSVQLAVKAGLVGLALQVLDGTKIQAVAADEGGWSKAHMEKLLAALDAELNEQDKQLETEQPTDKTLACRLPAQLEDRQALRETVKAGLAQLEQDDRSHYHPPEPEARRMKCGDRRPFAYNAQVVVDERCGMVVAAEVTVDEYDSAQLAPMLKEAQSNLGATKAVPSVADGGYGSGAQVAQAQTEGLDVVVTPIVGGMQKENGYSAQHFHYDAAAATVSCPQKQKLDFNRETMQKGQLIKEYRCHIKDCPAAALCKDKKGRRVIEIWPHTAAVQEMRERLKGAEAQERLSKRGRIVEKHFANVKQHEGFRRWTVRGFENVRTQWALLNLTSNLRVLAKNWTWQKQLLN